MSREVLAGDFQPPELQTMEFGRQGFHQNMESVPVVATEALGTPGLILHLAALLVTYTAIPAEFHSPQHGEQRLYLRTMRGVHKSQRSHRIGEVYEPQLLVQ